jgi:hypothetical protein
MTPNWSGTRHDFKNIKEIGIHGRDRRPSWLIVIRAIFSVGILVLLISVHTAALTETNKVNSNVTTKKKCNFVEIHQVEPKARRKWI